MTTTPAAAPALFVTVFGKVPFFYYYVLHIPLIHALVAAVPVTASGLST